MAVLWLFVNVNMLAVSVGDIFYIDNLKYQIKENNEVAFMGVERNVIKKEVVIPDAVSYGNVVYPVTSILEGNFSDVEKVVLVFIVLFPFFLFQLLIFCFCCGSALPLTGRNASA